MRGWWQRLWGGHGGEAAARGPRLTAAEPAPEAPPHAEGEWHVVTAARLQESREGQLLEYPGRTVECPRGHRRVVPTRFDQTIAELLCPHCGRRYPFCD